MVRDVIRALKRSFGIVSKRSQGARPISPHRSVHVGINDYPGAGQDLAGCLNDASDWESYCCSRGFSDRTLITNSAATGTKILEAMEWVIEGLVPGKTSVFTYSGHGCQVPDADGDETDGYDEALCAHDFTWNNPETLTDDVVFRVFSKAPPGSTIVFVADCCHSGTLHRGIGYVPRRISRVGEAAALRVPERRNGVRSIRDRTKDSSSLIVLSACSSQELAYDTSRRGRPCGAFTRSLLDSLAEKGDGITYGDLIKTAQSKITEPQHPELNGPRWAASCQVFLSERS